MLRRRRLTSPLPSQMPRTIRGRRLCVPIEEVRIRGIVRFVPRGGIQGDESRRVGKGQRPQQHAIDDAEDGGVRGDPDGEDGNDERAESEGLAEGAQCLAETLNTWEAREKGRGRKCSGRGRGYGSCPRPLPRLRYSVTAISMRSSTTRPSKRWMLRSAWRA